MANPPPINPLHNSGVTPTPAVPGYGPENLPSQPDVGGAKEFNLPTGKEVQPGGPEGVRPSPMDVAGQPSAMQRMTPDQLGQHIDGLRDRFTNIQQQLGNPNVAGKLTPEHFDALKTVTNKLNPDMRTIANASGGSFQPPKIDGSDKKSILEQIVSWVDSSQQTLGGAVNYLSDTKGQQQDMTSYLKLQYGVQRASQRAELFASIISSSVGGIKTIMSTQLG